MMIGLCMLKWYIQQWILLSFYKVQNEHTHTQQSRNCCSNCKILEIRNFYIIFHSFISSLSSFIWFQNRRSFHCIRTTNEKLKQYMNVPSSETHILRWILLIFFWSLFRSSLINVTSQVSKFICMTLRTTNGKPCS